MTRQEFSAMQWRSGMHILYKDNPTPYEVISVDFDEDLICFDDFPWDEDYPGRWVRCENCTILE